MKKRALPCPHSTMLPASQAQHRAPRQSQQPQGRIPHSSPFCPSRSMQLNPCLQVRRKLLAFVCVCVLGRPGSGWCLLCGHVCVCVCVCVCAGQGGKWGGVCYVQASGTVTFNFLHNLGHMLLLSPFRKWENRLQEVQNHD